MVVLDYIFAVLVFAVLAWLIVWLFRGGNLMFGVFFASVLFFTVGFIGYRFASPEFLATAAKDFGPWDFMRALKFVFQDGPVNWGGTLVQIVFGAWFGTVVMQTGVAAALIRKTVELGGDRPTITMLLLNVVVCACFTSMFGIGAAISLGVIVIPILMSIGIPKLLATISYCFSVINGFYLNPVLFAEMVQTRMNIANEEQFFFDSFYFRWAFPALLIHLVLIIVFELIYFKRDKTVSAWAAPTKVDEEPEVEIKQVPGFTLWMPVLPALLIIAFKIPTVPSFLFSGFVILACCGYLKSFSSSAEWMSRTFRDAVVENASLVGFLICLTPLANSIMYSSSYYGITIGRILPTDPLLVAVLFGALAPFAIFRGPTGLFGAGKATLIILWITMGINIQFMWPLIWGVTIGMMPVCPTQSYVAWGVGYNRIEGGTYIKKALPIGWLIAIGNCILTFVMLAQYA